MIIRTRLTLQFLVAAAIVFLLTIFAIYVHSEQSRSKSFFRNLKREAVTKAHLFLSGRVDARTMHEVYVNNTQFIDEVEVAIYRLPFTLLYHDAAQENALEMSPEMIADIARRGYVQFYEGDYQAVGMIYNFNDEDYVVTAVAYDGSGRDGIATLRRVIIFFSALGLLMLAFVGAVFARKMLDPIKQIVSRVRRISANNIEERLPVSTNNDELDELSRAFNSFLSDLDKAFTAQKMFVSNVSHELRTPMAALVAETELALLRPREPERYIASMKNILQDARRIISLIDGLLNLAKADYNPSQIKKEEVRVDEVLMEARSSILAAHPNYHIDIIFEQESDDDSVLTVYGNVYLLTMAFINLMENNCKFSRNQTSIVQIGHWQGQAVMTFSDNGIGISEKDQQNLFKPFYRGENQHFSAGHGIGMALVSKIVGLHKGTLEINSRKDEGTSFVLRLKHL